MVRPMPISQVVHGQFYFCSTPIAIGLFISVSVLLALCAQHSRKVSSRKYSTEKSSSSDSRKTSPRSQSPLPSPSFSVKRNIAVPTSHESDHPLISTSRRSSEEKSEVEKMYNKYKPGDRDIGEESGSAAGLWQKAIMMGEKCQPPEFSGVLFYDSYGNRISELPRSPRATPVRNISSFAQNT